MSDTKVEVAEVVRIGGLIRLKIGGLELVNESTIRECVLPEEVSKASIEYLKTCYGYDDYLIEESRVDRKWNKVTMTWAADQINKYSQQ